jgi:hypothetical protein
MNITLKQFKELVKKINSESQSPWNYDKKEINNTYLIIDKVYTGGMVGGSCWGDKSRYELTDESVIPSFKILEDLLTKNFPSIKLSIRNFFIIFNLITTESESECEYYGNRSDYIVYKIDVKSLYDLLTKEN